jgi:hypothetical protein
VLKLSDTSKEPGVTINAPVTPSHDPLPDLRFLEQERAEVSEKGQFIKIPCKDGINGSVYVGSFDGGGWTSLTAVAVFPCEDSLKGNLIKTGGETEIPIPKRNKGSKIATAWLTANGNPGEMDDGESSKGNSNKGDGLSAYEEYRGVISQGEFKRLDPKKKELGVKVDKGELPLFSAGLKLFQNETDLKVIIFHEQEIGGNRRLNKNAASAHIYDQYALVLYKGLLTGLAGSVFTSSNAPDIPANTHSVVIDINAINNDYNIMAARESPVRLPFTVSDYIANTTAHELGHGVSIWHHGQVPNFASPVSADPNHPPPIRIFNRNGSAINQPYTISGVIGREGNPESGDLNCFMAYVPYCHWAYTRGADGAWIFNEVPMLDVGRRICTSARGTGINVGIIYFGDAEKGNCLSQIKLKP